MNSPMSTHWSDDTELLERFVLNRLEPAKRQELEAHLRVCETCQRAVRAEQELVAGVRRLGSESISVGLRSVRKSKLKNKTRLDRRKADVLGRKKMRINQPVRQKGD